MQSTKLSKKPTPIAIWDSEILKPDLGLARGAPTHLLATDTIGRLKSAKVQLMPAVVKRLLMS
jgi:hypothetical protein